MTTKLLCLFYVPIPTDFSAGEKSGYQIRRKS